MKSNKIYLVIFFLLLVVYNKFFEFRPFLGFTNSLIVISFIILFVFTFKCFFFKKWLFIGSIKYIILSLFIAIIPSVLFNDQSLFHGVLAIAPFSYFLLFFFLIKTKINRNIVIKVLLALGYIALILFCYQFFISDKALFGGNEELVEDRGVLRIVFPGEGFMFFALFYYLNKLGKNFKIKYLIALIPFLLMMLLEVTRIFILAFGLITIYHFMIKSKVIYKILILMVFLVCYSFYYNTDNKIVKGIRDSAERDVEQKEDYIRIIEADYYLFKFSKNNTTYLLGNGAYYPKSDYGKKVARLEQNDHYYLDDLGLLKGYILFGVLFVLGYILIFIKSFTVKIPNDKLYLKYYIWMILILSVTTRANTNAGFGAVLATVLYLFEFANIEQNNLLKKKQIA